MANKFQNPWDVGGEYYNQNALNTQFLPEGFLETKQSYQEWKAERGKQGNFLFPRRAMEKIFKGYFLEKLQQYYQQKLTQITH